MKNHRRGAALVIALVTLLVVMLIAGTALRSLLAARRHARRGQQELQAQWLADAALARAAAQLRANPDYAGETWRPELGPQSIGVAVIRVERKTDASPKLIVQAHYPDHEFHRVSVSRERAISQPEAAP